MDAFKERSERRNAETGWKERPGLYWSNTAFSNFTNWLVTSLVAFHRLKLIEGAYLLPRDLLQVHTRRQVDWRTSRLVGIEP